MEIELKFRSLPELIRYFTDDKVCKDYLAEQRWHGSPSCPHCGSALKPYVTNRGYRCKEKECTKKFTVTTGTSFENTKIVLSTWYAAIYLITAHKKGISSVQLARDLGITQKTAWFMLHRIRMMLSNAPKSLLTGTVEVDETYIGGNPANKHEHKRKGPYEKNFIPVIAVVERGGAVRAVVAPDAKLSSIFPIISKNVEKGSRLITDGHSSYKFIGGMYDHVTVKHSFANGVKNYKTTGDKHTNTVEGFFSHLKRMIFGTYHVVSGKHLQRYCDELSYRFSTRYVKDVERFQVSLVGMNCRLKYVDLIKKQ